MESSSIFGAEKMEPNDFENNERALVALRDDDAAAFCKLTLQHGHGQQRKAQKHPPKTLLTLMRETQEKWQKNQKSA